MRPCRKVRDCRETKGGVGEEEVVSGRKDEKVIRWLEMVRRKRELVGKRRQ